MPTVAISNGSQVSQNHTFKLSINLAPYIKLNINLGSQAICDNI